MFVSHLEGSFSGVVGLPLFATTELLRKAGIELLDLPNPELTLGREERAVKR